MWRGVPRPRIHIRSASVAESGTRRSDEEQLWEAEGNLPFSRAKIGPFFQERPLLKNPFLEDALLRGYLRRHLPQEVRREHSWCFQLLLEILDKNDPTHLTTFGSSVIPEKGCH